MIIYQKGLIELITAAFKYQYLLSNDSPRTLFLQIILLCIIAKRLNFLPFYSTKSILCISASLIAAYHDSACSLSVNRG